MHMASLSLSIQVSTVSLGIMVNPLFIAAKILDISQVYRLNKFGKNFCVTDLSLNTQKWV